MAISEFTAPGTRVLKNGIFKECHTLPKLIEGKIYTVERITDCTRDAGGYGVCVLEVSGFHRPRECRDDEFTHICYYYDLDMFDLPVLPKCLTGLLTKERVLASSPLISSRSQEQQFRTRRGSLKGLRGYKK